MVPCLAAILCGLALAQEPYPPADSPVPAATEASRPPGVVAATADPASADSICLLIEAAAGQHGLPVTFLTRLIAQESGFRPSVVGPVTRSGARAQGIAQFMPYTARERGLLDPFDPVQALPHAASYLADLRRQFGSLGLAAAAYNAGPQRVQDWLDGKGGLPAETRHYVAVITGQDADSFAAARRGETTALPPAAAEPSTSCAAVRAALRQGPGPYLTALEQRIRTGGAMPWGVQLSGGFSRGKALAAFARAEQRHASLLAGKDTMILQTRMLSRGSRAFYQVRVGLPSRAASDSLCDRLRAAGGACLVLRNVRGRVRG
jgi:hypothetical protein